MSNNYFVNLLNVNLKNVQSKESIVKERGKSLSSIHKIPDIITQVKPFSQPINLHKSSYTPSNKSRDILQPNLLLPPKSSEFIDKKTLILDLDETLVHSSTSSIDKSDIILNVDFDGLLYNIYVLIRPGAENFIKKISKYFEIVVFTASLSKYASPLLDKLDKDKNIKYRLYREHCTFLNGIYIKELKKLNRELKDVIIVDNSPLAYSFDVENGLPIKSWYDDKNDIEFEYLFPILEFLSKVDDVRDYIGLFVENNEINYERAFQIIFTINNIGKNADNYEEKIDEDKNIDNKNSKKYKKQKNILSLHDFLSPTNNKIIGNLSNKNIMKTSLKLEDNKIQNINSLLKVNYIMQTGEKTKETNKTDKTDNRSIYINNNIINEKNKKKKNSFRNIKNSFRLNKNLAHISLKNMQNNELNKKINSLFPLTLSLTNSTKMINFSKKVNYMNNLKLVSIKDISNNNNNNSKNNINNNNLYTNLLESLKTNKDLFNNSLKNNTNNYRNKNLFLTRNSKSFKLSKNKNLLIQSPSFNQQRSLKLSNNNYNSSLKTARSKSTGNFIQFNIIKERPKRPKSNQRLFNLDLIDRKSTFKFGTSGLNVIKISHTNKGNFTPSNKQIKYKIKIKKLGFKQNIK